MAELLFLAHRIPYPPDKGDKIRSWNFLRHLAARHEVHLGCFIDDPRDWQFEAPLRGICRDCCFVPLDPRSARWRSLKGLAQRLPLTLPYYFDRRLARWVESALARPGLARAFAYCSAMAQYIPPGTRQPLRRIADLVDLDSEKWLEYGRRMAGLKALIWRREGRALRRVEQQVAACFDQTLFATEAEAALFCAAAPELSGRVHHIANGVDSDYFSPERDYPNPYPPGRTVLAFTGAMDYWPNVDAVTHFARAILPAVKARIPSASFAIVGAGPRPEVRALASGEDILVTGRVADVRPYAAHASVVVAPLRVARGIQNKVLEGMAMARPVVASAEALEGIRLEIGSDALRADTPADFADAICTAASAEAAARLGANARRRVLADFTWAASLRRLDACVDG